MLSILNLEPDNFSEVAKNILKKNFVYNEAGWESFLENNTLNESHIIIIRLKKIIEKAVMDKFPNLRYIVSATTGTDHIDLTYCKERGINIICLKPYLQFLETIPSTAEHTMALIFTLLRNIPKAVQSVEKGEWLRDNFFGTQLKGKTIGFIGLGRTGMQAAKFAEAFDMNIYYYDPNVSTNNKKYSKASSIEALIRASDIISLHVHLSGDTQYLINQSQKDFFTAEKYLINTSRGKIVDEKFVYDLLKENRLRGVASDVLEDEFNDIKNNWLHKAMVEGENVIITPHIAGATFDALHACEEFICKMLIETVTYKTQKSGLT